MRIAVMQPYIFPYLGYYQLVNSVDLFVFFDDVNYIKKGWINKNNILVNGEAYKFTIPVKDASQNKPIIKIEFSGYDDWRFKFLKTVEASYKKAPYFNDVLELINKILDQRFVSIAGLAKASVKEIAAYLNLKTEFENSSDISYDRNGENGQKKIIDICKLKKATCYVNPFNGRELYNKLEFESKGIKLLFLKMNEVTYMQYSKEKFIPSLSIIDILMFNDKETIHQLLNKLTLE
jgi:hypothetical protein